jgi:hypothetical protein
MAIFPVVNTTLKPRIGDKAAKKTPPTSILYKSSMKPKILLDNETANLCFNRATSWATNVVIVEQSNASIKMNFSMI